MTVALASLVPGSQFIGAVLGTYFTAQPGNTAKITNATITNVSAVAVAVTVYLVPFGATAGGPNTVLSAFSINAHTAYASNELKGKVIPDGWSLQAIASAPNALSFLVSGFIVS